MLGRNRPNKTNPEEQAGTQPRRRLLNRPWKARLAYLGLWGLLGLAVLRGLLAGGSNQEARAQSAPGQASASSALGPAGFAEMCLAAYLQAGEDTAGTLTSCFATPPALDGVTAGQFYVARSSVWDVTRVGDGYWGVMVAADLLEAVKGAYRPAGTRFYTIGVRKAKGGYVATGPPAQVARPPTADVPEPAISRITAPDPDDPVVATLTHFLAAFLAGQGELDRYRAPGNNLNPVDPPACAKVVLRAVGLNPDKPGAASYAARAQVECTNRQGHLQRLEYGLDLAKREDRWEVTRLHPAIPLAPADTKGQGAS